MKNIIRGLFIILFTLFLSLVIFDGQMFLISGTSMFPTLSHGDSCFSINKFFGDEIAIYREDVAIIDIEDQKLVKRVVGVPGDNVIIIAGSLIVNGERLDIPLVFDHTEGIFEIKLGENEYFVLGDNRPVSYDSRTFGPIKRENIKGKVVLKWRSPISI